MKGTALRQTTLAARLALRACRWILPILVVTLLAGCFGPWRDRYFDRGLHKLTQDQVMEKFGPPHSARTPALGGDTVWTYRYPMSYKELHPLDPLAFTRDARPTLPQTGSPLAKNPQPGSEGGSHETLYCYRYTLAFDENKVLKSWKREECIPGMSEKIDGQ